jgi:hypothetical protein
MTTVRILLRLTSVAIAGLFAARGGAWWIAAVLYLLITIAPIRPRGTRLALRASGVFTLAMAAAAAYLAMRGQPYALWAFLTVYGVLQAIQEKMAAPDKPGPAAQR